MADDILENMDFSKLDAVDAETPTDDETALPPADESTPPDQGVDATHTGGDTVEPPAEEVLEYADDETAPGKAADKGDTAADVTKPADAPATDAPVEPAPAEPADSKAAPQQAEETPANQELETAYADYRQRLETHHTKISAAGYEYDPYEDGKVAAALQTEGLLLEAKRNDALHAIHREAVEAKQLDAKWVAWGEANPGIPPAKGRAMFEEELAKAREILGPGEMAVGHAIAQFNARKRLLRTEPAKRTAPPVPTKGTPPVRKPGAPAAAPIVPRNISQASRPSQSAPDDEEVFVSKVKGKIREFAS